MASFATSVTFDICQYMFCHPQHVDIRKGMRKLMKWQEFPASNVLHIILFFSKADGLLSSIQLMHGLRKLESVDPICKMRGHNLQAHMYERSLALKWATCQGTTHFQVTFEDDKSIEFIRASLANAGVRTIMKTIRGNSQSESREDQFNSNTQATLHEDTLYEDSSFEEPALGEFLTQSDQLCTTQDTVRENYILTEREMCDETLGSDIDIMSLRSENSECSDPSGRETNYSSDAHKKDVTQIAKTKVGCGLMTAEIDVFQKAKSSETIHLPVETYSTGLVPMSMSTPIIWHHAGLLSGFMLSLISRNESVNVSVALSLGTEIIFEVKANMRFLRFYCTENIIVFFHSEASRRINKAAQIHMAKKDIDITRQWSAYWGIFSENPLEIIPQTEETQLNSNLNSSSSESFKSRESRFWSRRMRRPSSHNSRISRISMVSSISRISRISSHGMRAGLVNARNSSRKRQ